MRMWIFDNDETPQRFPLQRLLREVIMVTGAETEVCNLVGARGYGLRIHELEEQLETVDVVTIPVSELDTFMSGTEEWFYDVEAELPGTGIRFGLHDSTAMFVDGEESRVEAIAASFSNIRLAL